jgi:putative membrane protein
MANKRILSVLTTLPALLFFACTQSPHNRGIGDWDHMMGYGEGFMWLIVPVLVGVPIYFVVQASKSKSLSGSVTETPLDILKKRYAKDEIDKEEFNRMKDAVRLLIITKETLMSNLNTNWYQRGASLMN